MAVIWSICLVEGLFSCCLCFLYLFIVKCLQVHTVTHTGADDAFRDIFTYVNAYQFIKITHLILRLVLVFYTMYT